jgi:dUTP diphosphatase
MNDVPLFRFALREDLQEEKKFLPERVEPFSTGWDVRASQPDRKDIVLRAGQTCKIPLGFRCLIPRGYWLELKPRSSTFVKKHLHALYGTIDCDFGFQMHFCSTYLPDINSLSKDLIIKFGDRLGQIIPFKLQEMKTEEISNREFDQLFAERNPVRSGGFGSSGDQ